MSKIGEYQAKYKELEVIGRGNFGKLFVYGILLLFLLIGSATLVQNLTENGKIYVAKKILLGGLKEKEQQSSLLEVDNLISQV